MSIRPRLAALAVGLIAAFGMTASSAHAALHTYNVVTHTGDRSNAGTDSDVYVKLYGTLGVTPEKFLDNREDNFERNKYDSFDFLSNDVGTVTTVCVRFDDRGGWSSGWYLDWVMVDDTYFSLYYRWFERDETDCRSVA